MTTISLVRHGKSEWNKIGLMQGRTDVELSDEGRAQAVKAGQYLKNSSWDCIVSSPLMRAKETAEIIGMQVDIKEIDQVEDLVERDWGEATGLHTVEVDAKYPDNNIPGLEQWEDLKNRGVGALKKIVKMHPNKRIIVVSHGALIRATLDNLTKGQMNLEIGRIGNTSINIINYDNEEFQIESFNILEHLDEVAASNENYE